MASTAVYTQAAALWSHSVSIQFPQQTVTPPDLYICIYQ